MVESKDGDAASGTGYLCLIFVRHGERGDFVDDDTASDACYLSTTDHDPNLTAIGLAQATEAGAYFKKRLQGVEQEYGITFT